MDKLPVEVLQAIFMWTLPSTKEMRNEESGLPSAGLLVPLYISHVCRRWREVSLDVSSLWSHLSIDYSKKTKEWNALLNVYHTWLQRTRQSPINFQIFLCFYQWTSEPEDHSTSEHIASVTLSHQRRWKDVDFHWMFHLSPESTGLELTDMPMLERAKFHFCIDSHLGLATEPQLSIARSPLLEDLNLDGCYLLDIGEGPLYALRRARLVNRHWKCEVAQKICLKLLEVAPNLKELSICFSQAIYAKSPQNVAVSSANTLVHDGIQTLEIGSSFAEYILPMLTLPSLRHLHCTWDKITELQTLLEFVQRSSPPLESLKFSGFCSPDVTIPLLRLYSTLQKLQYCSTQYLSSLFRELTFDDDNRKTCPELHTLDIRVWFFSNEIDRNDSMDALCAMLDSRFSGCATISVSEDAEEVPIERSDAFHEWLISKVKRGFEEENRIVIKTTNR